MLFLHHVDPPRLRWSVSESNPDKRFAIYGRTGVWLIDKLSAGDPMKGVCVLAQAFRSAKGRGSVTAVSRRPSTVASSAVPGAAAVRSTRAKPRLASKRGE